MNLQLRRFAYLPEGTLGELFVPYGHSLYTIERPWLDNKPFESCIPEGDYAVKPFNGTRFKDVWQLMDVPDRSYILIHTANRPSDVQGCIGVGLFWHISGKSPIVEESRKAVQSLHEIDDLRSIGSITVTSVNGTV